MAYKTIVAVLDTPENAQTAIDFACALAVEHQSHVVGLHAEIVAAVPLVVPMEIPDPVAVQALQDMARAEARQVERTFRSTVERHAVSSEWLNFSTSVGYGSQPLLERARSADLLLAVQPDPAKPSDAHVDVESFLFESGRPVLMVPYIFKTPKPIKRVLIAWNGSKEAARATFDAMPFLKAADAVEVFSVEPVESAAHANYGHGADIAATLARHGVKATHKTTETADRTAQVIANRLSDSSIDLLVMGAYTHSRLWEMIFGGTTKRLLKSMTALTLLAR
jgi:nucleotide-binding universal stress UspA family protein